MTTREITDRLGRGTAPRCICGAPLEGAAPLFRVKAEISICRCGVCGQVFTWPPPYRSVEECEIYSRPDAVHGSSRRAEEFLGYARLSLSLLGGPESPGGKSLLDFGCGGGEVLMAGEALGMRVRGVEINPHRRSRLTQRGFLVAGSLEEFRGRAFDVVVLSHVLEHIPDPCGFLMETRAFMRRGASLLVSVPSFDSYFSVKLHRYWPGLQVDQHLWHFTSDSLASLLNRCGFAVTLTERHALGKGIDVRGDACYADAMALLDTQGSPTVRLAFFALLCLDRAAMGAIGKAIRKHGERKGGDNLFVAASMRSSSEA